MTILKFQHEIQEVYVPEIEGEAGNEKVMKIKFYEVFYFGLFEA